MLVAWRVLFIVAAITAVLWIFIGICEKRNKK